MNFLYMIYLLILNNIFLVPYFIVNLTKKNFQFPLLYKVSLYVLILPIQLLAGLVYFFILFNDYQQLLLTYCFIIISAAVIYFILDEDFVFRLEKGISLILMIFISTILISFWYLLLT
jgi:hypothetical protein